MDVCNQFVYYFSGNIRQTSVTGKQRGTVVAIIETSTLEVEEMTSEIIGASTIIGSLRSSSKNVSRRTFQATKRQPKTLTCTTEMPSTEMGAITAAPREGVDGHREAVTAAGGIIISTEMQRDTMSTEMVVMMNTMAVKLLRWTTVQCPHMDIPARPVGTTHLLIWVPMNTDVIGGRNARIAIPTITRPTTENPDSTRRRVTTKNTTTIRAVRKRPKRRDKRGQFFGCVLLLIIRFAVCNE